MRISDKLKAIIAAIGLITTPLVAATADNIINISEGQALIAAGVEAAIMIWAVWRVPNQGFVNTAHMHSSTRARVEREINALRG